MIVVFQGVDNALDEIDLRSLADKAPTVFEQLESDAEDETVAVYVERYKDGVTGFVAELLEWCQQQLRDAAGEDCTSSGRSTSRLEASRAAVRYVGDLRALPDHPRQSTLQATARAPGGAGMAAQDPGPADAAWSGGS